ncbi:MAG: hypothetical protein QGG90_01540 [Nitrospinota bacterium]|nr:hypothetical protein [Nitrospinota bacterium]
MSALNQEPLGERLSAYLEGDLGEADRAKVNELLRTNENARKELEALRETVSLLGKMEELDPSVSLWSAVSRRIDGEAPAGAAEGGDWRRWVRRFFQPVAVTLPVGAAVAAALIFFVVSGMREREETRILTARVKGLEAGLARESALRERLDADRVKRIQAALNLRNRESDALSLLVSEQLHTLAETRAALKREREGGSAGAERPLSRAKAAPPFKSSAAVQVPPVALNVTFPPALEAGVLGEVLAAEGKPWSAAPGAGPEAAWWMSVGPEGRGLYVLSGEKLPSLIRRLQVFRGVVLRSGAESKAAMKGRVLIRVEISRAPAPP